MSAKDALTLSLQAKVEEQRAIIEMMRPMYNIGHALCVRLEIDRDTLTFVFNGNRDSFSRGVDKWLYKRQEESPSFSLATEYFHIRIVLKLRNIYVYDYRFGALFDYPYSPCQKEMLMDQFMRVVEVWNAVPAELY